MRKLFQVRDWNKTKMFFYGQKKPNLILNTNNLQYGYKSVDHINISLGLDRHQQLSFEIYHLLYAAFAVHNFESAKTHLQWEGCLMHAGKAKRLGS